jgi:hypothetical protein
MVSMSVFIVFCIVAFMLGGVVAFAIFCCLIMASKGDEPNEGKIQSDNEGSI